MQSNAPVTLKKRPLILRSIPRDPDIDIAFVTAAGVDRQRIRRVSREQVFKEIQAELPLAPYEIKFLFMRIAFPIRKDEYFKSVDDYEELLAKIIKLYYSDFGNSYFITSGIPTDEAKLQNWIEDTFDSDQLMIYGATYLRELYVWQQIKEYLMSQGDFIRDLRIDHLKRLDEMPDFDEELEQFKRDTKYWAQEVELPTGTEEFGISNDIDYELVEDRLELINQIGVEIDHLNVRLMWWESIRHIEGNLDSGHHIFLTGGHGIGKTNVFIPWLTKLLLEKSPSSVITSLNATELVWDGEEQIDFLILDETFILYTGIEQRSLEGINVDPAKLLGSDKYFEKIGIDRDDLEKLLADANRSGTKLVIIMPEPLSDQRELACDFMSSLGFAAIDLGYLTLSKGFVSDFLHDLGFEDEVIERIINDDFLRNPRIFSSVLIRHILRPAINFNIQLGLTELNDALLYLMDPFHIDPPWWVEKFALEGRNLFFDQQESLGEAMLRSAIKSGITETDLSSIVRSSYDFTERFGELAPLLSDAGGRTPNPVIR